MLEQLVFWTWLIFRGLFVGLLFLFLISGLDDLFVDLIYYVRHLFRFIFRRKVIKPISVEQLSAVPEKNAAILIPAWDESSVIFDMLLNTVATINYTNFHIFVGSYPNDEATRIAVEKAREVYANINVIVTPADGPTNKADCLNWVLQGMRVFEKDHNVRFHFVVMHDAEDVVHPLSLKFYNMLIPRAHFIQIPVFPFKVSWSNLVTGVYMDEFAETHTKDLRVRELMTTALPSAGVGTAISREAIDHLAAESNNQIFDIATLTEDYMMGLRLSKFSGKKIFLQQQVLPANAPVTQAGERVTREPLATRGFFPTGFRPAVRQKARWILGIALQGWSFGWARTFGDNYFLYRDRKILLTNLGVVLGYVVVLYSVIHSYVRQFTDIAVPPLIEADEYYFDILRIVLILFVWRILNRVVSSWRIYGPLHGFMAIPRLIVGNVLNFCATCSAIQRFVSAKISGEVPEWGKTDHAFPTEAQLRGYHRRLGDLLLERHFITTDQLEEALKLQKESGERLGDILVQMGALWEEDLVHAVAAQDSRPTCEIDPYATPQHLIRSVPLEVAEVYNIFPLRVEHDVLVLATSDDRAEQARTDVETALGCRVTFEWCATTDIHFARQQVYVNHRSAPPVASRLGAKLVEDGTISEKTLEEALRKQKRSHARLGDMLLEMEAIDQATLDAALQAGNPAESTSTGESSDA